jgi:hypothetical protein
VVWSLAYLVVRRLFELIVVCCRSSGSKELEILVLRHELSILRRRTSAHRRGTPVRSLVGPCPRGNLARSCASRRGYVRTKPRLLPKRRGASIERSLLESRPTCPPVYSTGVADLDR